MGSNETCLSIRSYLASNRQPGISIPNVAKFSNTKREIENRNRMFTSRRAAGCRRAAARRASRRAPARSARRSPRLSQATRTKRASEVVGVVCSRESWNRWDGRGKTNRRGLPQPALFADAAANNTEFRKNDTKAFGSFRFHYYYCRRSMRCAGARASAAGWRQATSAPAATRLAPAVACVRT